jgi:hypothetical protein
MLDAHGHETVDTAGPLDATLVLDSRTGASRLGMRSGGTAERRLLFHSSCAHIEIRIAPSRDPARPAWLHGLFVAPGAGASLGRVRVALTSGGAPTEVDTIETGEFALPCDPSQPIALQFLPPEGPPVRVRIEA